MKDNIISTCKLETKQAIDNINRTKSEFDEKTIN